MQLSMLRGSLVASSTKARAPHFPLRPCIKVAPPRPSRPQAVMEVATTTMENLPKELQEAMEKLKRKQAKATEKFQKAERKLLRKAAEARGALYFLHWHSVAPTSVIPADAMSTKGCSTETKEYITKLQDDLQRMEAVSKDALWYLTKEADDGMHVLLVTAKAKHGEKYCLEELPAAAETHTVQLGAAGAVDIPVRSLREIAMQGGADMSSMSMEDEDIMGSGVAAAAKVKEEAKQQKKMAKAERKMEEQKQKVGCLDMAGVGVVEEDPVAREHAMQLLGQMADSHAAAATEVPMGKEEMKEKKKEEKKMEKEAKEKMKAEEKMKKMEMKKAEMDMMKMEEADSCEDSSEDDDSSCSDSESGSDEEAAAMECKGQAMKMDAAKV